MAIIGILTGVLLLNVLVGNAISQLSRTLVFAIAMQIIFGITIHSSLSPSPKAAFLRKLFGICSGILCALFVVLILFDHRWHQTQRLLLDMEPATCLLVFGITLWPFSFILLWATGFHTAILPPASAAAVKQQQAEH